MQIQATTTTRSEDQQSTNPKFYPCYLNVNRVRSTTAFGWNGLYGVRAKVEAEDELVTHLRSLSWITDKFDDYKIQELARFYLNHAMVIRELQRFAYAYILNFMSISKTIEQERNPYDNDELIDTWERKLLEWYERYRTAESLIEKICYEQMLSDILWNPAFDPRDPRIVDFNLKQLEKFKLKVTNMVQEWDDDVITESFQQVDIPDFPIELSESIKEGIKRIKAKLSPKRYTFDVDEEGTILIKKNYQADLIRYYKGANRLMKLYKRQMKLDELKAELAKIYFINELIETKYIFNQHMTEEERSKYKQYADLRANVLSTFKMNLEFVLQNEDNFNFMHYYENSPYASVLKVSRTQVSGVKKVLKALII